MSTVLSPSVSVSFHSTSPNFEISVSAILRLDVPWFEFFLRFLIVSLQKTQAGTSTSVFKENIREVVFRQVSIGLSFLTCEAQKTTH